MTVTFEQLKKAEENFDRVQTKYSRYGAADSEPSATFREYARKTIETGEVVLPKSADTWELFTHSMNCGTAARALTAAAKKVYKLLVKAPTKVVEEFENYYL